MWMPPGNLMWSDDDMDAKAGKDQKDVCQYKKCQIEAQMMSDLGQS